MAKGFFGSKLDPRTWFSRRLAPQGWFDPRLAKVATPSTFQAAWAVRCNQGDHS